jgi:hypothetical protein
MNCFQPLVSNSTLRRYSLEARAEQRAHPARHLRQIQQTAHGAVVKL